MSAEATERSVRALRVLVRIRQVEEREALEETVESRCSWERERASLEGIREARRRLESRERGLAERGGDGRDLIARRIWADRLRSREEACEQTLAGLRREWAERQATFQAARSRRRVTETLHDRRSERLEERVRTEAERGNDGVGARAPLLDWVGKVKA